jgi:methionyl-tRNA formyltransferase
MVVVAYGLILPKSVLALPRLGCWNVHASLLPRWRGAAPIQRAIEAGDAETGVCLMQMEKGLDTGPVLLSQRTPIGVAETGGELHDRLAVLGAQVLSDGLGLLRAGMKPVAVPQPDAGATYAAKLDKAEAKLDWTRPAEALPLAHGAPPGTVLLARREGIDVACGEGALRLLRVQREGGRPVAVSDYLNARPLAGRA